MQKDDVQDMALDPLAAVKQAAERRRGSGRSSPKSDSKAWQALIW